MKRFVKILKIILIAVVIFISCFTFIYRNRIKLYINIGKKYVYLQKKLHSDIHIKDINAMNTIYAENIVYKNTNNVPLTLDIYKSKKKLSKGSPVILYVHGGSWVYGDKSIPSALSPLLDVFREEGFTIISVEYQLMKPGVGFDKLVSDIKDAVRWVYKNQYEYNFNTNEIGILGISSGAHLSLLAAYTGDNEFKDDSNLEVYPSKVKYVIDILGPTDLNSLNFSKATWDINNILKSIPNIKYVVSKYSPINYVHENAPKTLMVYSKKDTLVSYKNSTELYNKCVENGVFVKLVTLENSSHDFSNLSKQDILLLSKEVLKFIVQNSPL
ncbi:acetyl esterase [Clostridium acetireducens DSM 10703]|uniref:Acetyl esterase n=1 Tax=Clostridium acetireducens DSM 10703 TaxID=1121290 RepID=A0A1E8EVQ3_9CLOT|nr:alpha/beta hydrolase [Clostridium acetireducens]OFH99486.1 acetyl esterase [Clostridium acetireducens DSM 10703]